MVTKTYLKEHKSCMSMLCPLIKLINGDLSPQDCINSISEELLDYTTSDVTYIESKKVMLKGKKVKFLYEELLKIIDKLEKIEQD